MPAPHSGHSHHASASSKAVVPAALLTGAYMFAGVIGGLWSGSLALLADARHMLTDFAALSMAWLAFHIGRRPAGSTRTCGFDRLSVLAAFVNGLALFGVAVWIVIEAFHRLKAPKQILSEDPSAPAGPLPACGPALT